MPDLIQIFQSKVEAAVKLSQEFTYVQYDFVTVYKYMKSQAKPLPINQRCVSRNKGNSLQGISYSSFLWPFLETIYPAFRSENIQVLSLAIFVAMADRCVCSNLCVHWELMVVNNGTFCGNNMFKRKACVRIYKQRCHKWQHICPMPCYISKKLLL